MFLSGKQFAMIKFHLLLVLLVPILCVMADSPVSYKDYRVYEVKENARDPPIMKTTQKNSGAFILKTSRMGISADGTYVLRSYLVPKHEEKEFVTNLKNAGAKYSVAVEDLGQLIDGEKKSSKSTRRSGAKPSHTDAYFSYKEIINRTNELAKKNNSASGKPLAIVEKIGKTYEKRDMYVVKISSNHSAGKPIALIEAGMHAREWLAPATALHIIYELVDNYTAHKAILENFDFYIIPVSNPDGYEYSRTTDRLWRKTRSAYRNGYGTDGNRNFDFHWGKHGSSNDPEDDTFGGPFAFSENETRNIRDLGMKYKNRIFFFLSIHAYGALFVYPWSYARTAMAPFTPEMKKAVTAASKAIEANNGTKYTVGNSAELMYDSPGGADDYFKGVLGVEMSFTMELSDDGQGSFVVPATKIKKIVKEAFEGIKALSKESYSFYKANKKASKRRHGC